MKNDTKDEAPRGFAVLLGQIDDGALHAEISEVVQEVAKTLTAGVDNFGVDQKGSVTLTLKLKARKDGTILIEGDVKKKVPELRRGTGLFWLSPGGNLSPENPRQQKLPLRAVEAPAQPVRDAAPEAAPTRAV